MADSLHHLVLGDSAAGRLRDAITQGVVLPAEIIRFRDVLALGPLGALGTPDGAASRAAYWGELLPGAAPTVSEFEEEEARYDEAASAAGGGATLLPWIGGHSSSQLWLQRLCSALPAHADVRVIDVAQTPQGRRSGRRALGQFEPRELGALLNHQRRLAADEIGRLAAQWQENAAVVSGVRRWEQSGTAGAITHHADDYYDGLVLAQCTADWQPAAQVIGSAQWECDEYLGDVFFAWRLRLLVRSGHVELQGDRSDPGRAWVRAFRE